MRCRGEVEPERLSLSIDIIDAIAQWNYIYVALYALWLDSGEYEEWAAEQLSSPDGQINKSGMEICSRLSAKIPTYYFWFYKEAGSNLICPVCFTELIIRGGHSLERCENCKIVF